YMAYTDEFPDESNDTDIYVRYSDDNGATWSERVRVNDDTGTRSQFLPAIALDQTTGNVAVTWYDSRNSSGATLNITAQVFGSVASDGGLTWSPNVQIGAGTSNGRQADFEWGDYDTMDFYGGVFYRTWADNSNSTSDNPDSIWSSMDLYTAQVRVGLGVIRSTPANGAVVTEPPTSFVIKLLGLYDPASVQPTALTVNGIAADHVQFTSSDTLTF